MQYLCAVHKSEFLWFHSQTNLESKEFQNIYSGVLTMSAFTMPLVVQVSG